MNEQRRRLVHALTGVLGAAIAPASFAQAWPARSVRLISPYGPGGSNDILTRLLGQFLSDRLGQPVVVDNKAGAGTRIANELLARAPADGYTVLHAAAPIAIGEALYRNLPYSLEKDFVPVVSTAIAPLFLVVNADAPYKTLAEFVRYGKKAPKGLTFGSPGAGSAPHLTAELFLRAADAPGLNVHFRGDAQAYVELLAGRIDATLTAVSTAISHIEANKLRVLAVATEERTSVYPSAPTFREQGMQTVVGYGGYGLRVPPGTPGAVVERLNAETNAAIGDPEIRKKAEAAGLQLRGGTAAEFAGFIGQEKAKWAQVIKAANITVE